MGLLAVQNTKTQTLSPASSLNRFPPPFAPSTHPSNVQLGIVLVTSTHKAITSIDSYLKSFGDSTQGEGMCGWLQVVLCMGVWVHSCHHRLCLNPLHIRYVSKSEDKTEDWAHRKRFRGGQ